MELLIVTGKSGAGKSRALDILEDIGFYCIDNLPPQIIISFVDFMLKNDNTPQRIAFGIDSRSRSMFKDIGKVLIDLERRGVAYRILFLDCSNDVLARRFKETRRRHPLAKTEDISLAEALEREAKYLSDVHEKADYLVDTTHLRPAQLRNKILKMLALEGSDVMVINVYSFGFKHGTVRDADLLFDVRCLPNPFYIPELRQLTGNDAGIVDYVMSFAESQGMLEKILALLDFTVPLYIAEGKAELVIGIGCTGGKHRSVTFANAICKHLGEQHYHAVVSHRDIDK